jgi:ribonuclease P protein component
VTASLTTRASAGRVRRHKDFQRIQSPEERAGRATSAHFVFLVARTPAEESGAPRLGLVVTKKVGGAVQRNRVKRVCRACFRLSPGLVPDGVDLVVIAKTGAPALGLGDVQREWEGARPLLARRAREALARPATPTHVARRPAGTGAT